MNYFSIKKIVELLVVTDIKTKFSSFIQLIVFLEHMIFTCIFTFLGHSLRGMGMGHGPWPYLNYFFVRLGPVLNQNSYSLYLEFYLGFHPLHDRKMRLLNEAQGRSSKIRFSTVLLFKLLIIQTINIKKINIRPISSSKF
jgi:hypothetical protein